MSSILRGSIQRDLSAGLAVACGLFVVALLLMPGFAVADSVTDSVTAQQQAYLSGLKAVRHDDKANYSSALEALQGSVLRGQLQYHYLRRHLADANEDMLRMWLYANRYSYSSVALRTRWLYRLARQGDWDEYMREYRTDLKDHTLYCYWLDHALKEPDSDQWALMARVSDLWNTGRRLPRACNAVFDQWRAAGQMTRDAVFSRIKLAMEAHRISLARQLAHYLPRKDRVWVTRWITMHRHPARELQHINYPLDTPVARMIVNHGIARLAYRDPHEAMHVWKALKEKYQFFGEDDNYVLRQVGIIAAKDHLPEAVDWLSAVSASSSDEDVRVWRVRAAMWAGDWKLARQFYGSLTQDEQDSDEWRYWKARIDEQLGELNKAWGIYSSLAHERSYYGFLAADHIGAPYSMQNHDIDVSPEEVRQVAARPDVRLATELYKIGEILDARRQWRWTIRHMNPHDLKVAAVVAQDVGWHDRAIYTAAISGHVDDLDLRFPLLYRHLVEKNAERTGIDPGWIYGIMRQESAFVTDARSQAGALGLMQLLPQTGRATARRLRLHIHSQSAILQVKNNVRLGAYYLRTVLRRHDNNLVLATAAYNAGSHRVKQWLPETGEKRADLWVESIPYDETRDYVKNVLGYTAIYEHRLDVEPTELLKRMPAVEAPNSN
jgi:soluble lytic murein transglycosylase